MCIFCGGQCGGVGEFLISLGLPFLALYFTRIKAFLAKITHKIVRRKPPEAGLDESIKCTCCGEPRQDCREIAPQSIDLKNLALVELKSPDNERIAISSETPKFDNQAKLEKEAAAGVKGWLLLLCLNFTIFIPATYLYQINCVLNLYNSSRNKILLFMFKGLLLYNMAIIVTMIFLAIFSFYAGLRLWNVKLGAVRTAKAFLIIQLFLTFILAIIRPFMTFSSGANGKVFGAILITLIPSLLQFGLWYLYLSKSSRVYKTYGAIREKGLDLIQRPIELKGHTELTQE